MEKPPFMIEGKAYGVEIVKQAPASEGAPLRNQEQSARTQKDGERPLHGLDKIG
jgi:hypothetical protein